MKPDQPALEGEGVHLVITLSRLEISADFSQAFQVCHIQA